MITSSVEASYSMQTNYPCKATVRKRWHVCRTRYELSMASDADMENGDGQVSIMSLL